MSTNTIDEAFRLEAANGFRFDSWPHFVKHLAERPHSTGRRMKQGGAGSPANGNDESWLFCAWGRNKEALLWGKPRTGDGRDLAQRLDLLLSGSATVRRADLRLLNELNRINESAELLPQDMATVIGVAGIVERLVRFCDSDSGTVLLQCLESIRARSCQQSGAIGILGNELAMVLGCQIPELKMFSELSELAMQETGNQLDELLDTDGALLAVHCRWLPTILGSWTRILMLGNSVGVLLDEDCQTRWEWFVRYSMRMLLGDGTTMFADASIPFTPELYRSAVRLSEDKTDRRIAVELLGGRKRTGSKKQKSKSKRVSGGNGGPKKRQALREEGTFSEWAGLGVFQSDWSGKSARVAVAVDQQDLQIQVARGRTLFRLKGLPNVSVNGKLLRAEGEWEEVGSHFDEDVDFLELEIDLQGGVRLQRQLCLIHDDQTLLIADAVYSEDSARIDYHSQLLLSSGLTAMQETENQEVYLQGKKIQNLLVPLSLPEWRSANGDNRLAVTDDGVQLNQATLGKTLYAALLVTLQPRDAVKPRTWRALTVAESMQTVTDDRARAFRAQVGKKQWVIYKSFAETGNRTFLGQNQSNDFFVGRFKKDGNVQELLSLDP